MRSWDVSQELCSPQLALEPLHVVIHHWPQGLAFSEWPTCPLLALPRTCPHSPCCSLDPCLALSPAHRPGCLLAYSLHTWEAPPPDRGSVALTLPGGSGPADCPKCPKDSTKAGWLYLSVFLNLGPFCLKKC